MVVVFIHRWHIRYDLSGDVDQAATNGVAKAQTMCRVVFDQPVKGQKFGFEPIKCMWPLAVGIGAGELAQSVVVADSQVTLVLAENDESRDPDPRRLIFNQDLDELRMPGVGALDPRVPMVTRSVCHQKAVANISVSQRLAGHRGLLR